MKKTYRFKFSPLILVLAGVINVLLLIVVILNVLKLAEVGTFDSFNPPLDIAATIVSIILLIVVNTFLFASSYRLKDGYLLYILGFFVRKIKYDDILIIREEKTTRALVVNYKKGDIDEDNNEYITLQGLVINISNKQKDDFVASLREKNTAITYELLDKELDK